MKFPQLFPAGAAAVVLTFEPFDEFHQLYAGYYKTIEVANAAAFFIINLHSLNKVGCGFNTEILSLSERYVEYDSGKSYIKTGEGDSEVKSSCDHKEYLRLIEIVDAAINKWSRK